MVLTPDEQRVYELLDARRRESATDSDLDARIRRIVQQQVQATGPLAGLAQQLSTQPFTPPAPAPGTAALPAQYAAFATELRDICLRALTPEQLGALTVMWLSAGERAPVMTIDGVRQFLRGSEGADLIRLAVDAFLGKIRQTGAKDAGNG